MVPPFRLGAKILKIWAEVRDSPGKAKNKNRGILRVYHLSCLPELHGGICRKMSQLWAGTTRWAVNATSPRARQGKSSHFWPQSQRLSEEARSQLPCTLSWPRLTFLTDLLTPSWPLPRGGRQPFQRRVCDDFHTSLKGMQKPQFPTHVHVYNSVIFSTFIELCSYYHNPILEQCHLPLRSH